MFDSFPYDRWSDTVTDFWTFGPHDSVGTYVLTALGIALAGAALVGWIWRENRALERAAAALRGSGPPTPPDEAGSET